ncbi:MAG: polysulfide reductase NrfD [Firmicutes bacterium]|nr:polysulfide reductase NrfD [Bacillota bacterium]
MNAEAEVREMEAAVLRPVTERSRTFILFVLAAVAVILWALYAWSVQLRNGLEVTGMRNHVSWGFYITNFVFWIGISHAGTFISAVLRLTGVGWRTPVVRMAEFMTVGALLVGGAMPVVDLGRPDRILNLIYHGQLNSPILWDLLSVTSYFTGTLIYLYLPLIPDLATCRDRLSDKVGPLRRWFFHTFSLGWQGTPEQWRLLNKGIRAMCMMIIAVMISVHTVVSFIFAMTWRAGWHSTIFGPYFVIGAIYSGIAAVVTEMWIFRKTFRFQKYITPNHFRWLGNILLAAGLVYFYFTSAEYITAVYKMSEHELGLLQALFHGPYSGYFWSYWIGGMAIPLLLLSLPRTRNMLGIGIASILINIFMWIKRYFIVIPSMAVPLQPTPWGSYSPTWVEISIVAATFAGFALIVGTLGKSVPLIPMWEMAEELEIESDARDLAERKRSAPRPAGPVPGYAPGGGAGR